MEICLEVEKGIYLFTDNNCEIFPEVEVRMKMHAEGLYFIKIQKSPDEDWHEQNQ